MLVANNNPWCTVYTTFLNELYPNLFKKAKYLITLKCRNWTLVILAHFKENVILQVPEFKIPNTGLVLKNYHRFN